MRRVVYKDDWGEEQEKANRLPTPDTRYILLSDLRPFLHAYSRLTPSEQQVFISQFLDHDGPSKIADRMGVTKGCVSKWIQRIKDKIHLSASLIRTLPAGCYQGDLPSHSSVVGCRTEECRSSEEIDESEVASVARETPFRRGYSQ